MSHASARVTLGVIVGVKGLRGEVRIKSFTTVPANVAAYGPVLTDDGRSLHLKVTGAAQGVVTARIDGVNDRAAAEALKGVKLTVERKALPATDDGSYYHADLIGMAVDLASGPALGKVKAVYNFGGGDMIEVEMPNGTSELVPFTAAVVAGVDTASGRITVNALPGLFENDSEADERERQKEQQGPEGERANNG